MAMVIVDFGSGNTCRNDAAYVRRMIDGLAAVDPQRKAVIKFQLFLPATVPHCVPLRHKTFARAYNYAASLGYRTTASVFDEYSLDYLLRFDVPFVKLAALPSERKVGDYRYPLIAKVPRGVPIVASAYDKISWLRLSTTDASIMCCVPAYPATAAEYEARFIPEGMTRGISDHTADLTLWRKYQPSVYERHFKLPDSTGLDSGEFASTPEMWREVFND